MGVEGWHWCRWALIHWSGNCQEMLEQKEGYVLISIFSNCCSLLQVGGLGIFLMMIRNNGACMQTLLAVREGPYNDVPVLKCVNFSNKSCELFNTSCSIFDLSTPLYPAYFLPLASLGNLAKAVASGLKDPSLRVIQSHFAVSGNLGEVAAKEEVWEVSAKLLGLGLGILVLDTPGLVKSYPVLAMTWTSVRLLHLWLRYQSLSVLQFNTINLKRARILVKSHVLSATVPGCFDCNKNENILVWERFLKPQIIFGVPFEEMIGGDRSVSKVKGLLELYTKEKYILVVNEEVEFVVFVSFKVGATGLSVLRSVWQTYWLHENWGRLDNRLDLLGQSLVELESRFSNFMLQLEGAGWNTRRINLKVPKEISIDELVK